MGTGGWEIVRALGGASSTRCRERRPRLPMKMLAGLMSCGWMCVHVDYAVAAIGCRAGKQCCKFMPNYNAPNTSLL